MAITIALNDIKRRLQLPAGEVNCTFTNAGDLITSVLHGLAVNDIISFTETSGGVTAGVSYWVKTITNQDVFTISATLGGALLALTDDGAHVYTQKSVYDAKITAIVAEMLVGLSGMIVAAHLATYEAACKQGMIDVIAGECLNMLRRQPGYAEAAKFGGNEVGEAAESGDKLIARGMAILEPFTVAGDAALDKVIAEVAKVTADTAKVTADKLLVDATELKTDAETAVLTADKLLVDAKTLTEAEMVAKVAADAALSTGLAADATARGLAATARTARMAAEDAAIADATDLPQESHEGNTDSPFAFDRPEYLS
ncbi:MAG TPA: hypothetical protein VMX94_06075 [Armatimonadota bacterium]|nr:hypothetical protein [Armatimonadota bacterium]